MKHTAKHETTNDIIRMPKKTKCIINKPVFVRPIYSYTFKSPSLWIFGTNYVVQHILYHIFAGWLAGRIRYILHLGELFILFSPVRLQIPCFVVVVDVSFSTALIGVEIILSVCAFVVGVVLSFIRIVESEPAKLDWEDSAMAMEKYCNNIR